jgi:hypothetical protein
LSEAFHLLGTRGGPALAALLKHRAVVVGFDLGEQMAVRPSPCCHHEDDEVARDD